MKLVLIYGPPAAGKLTVATELAEMTGFKLFHNHLTMNAVRPVFEWGSPELVRVLHRIRLEIFKEAAECGISLVYTLANPRRKDNERPTVLDVFTDEVGRIVREHGGTLCRVQLRPPIEVLLERVVSESRALHDKLNDPEHFHEFVRERELYDLIDPSDLSIDNSQRSPADVAAQIREHFAL